MFNDKIEPALDRLHTALEKLGAGVHQSRRNEDAARAETADLDNQCAHLRAEVSALKNIIKNSMHAVVGARSKSKK